MSFYLFTIRPQIFDVMKLDVNTHAGKKLRAELLVGLKEGAGLSYREIARMDPFGDLSMSSLGTIYQRCRKRHLS